MTYFVSGASGGTKNLINPAAVIYVPENGGQMVTVIRSAWFSDRRQYIIRSSYIKSVEQCCHCHSRFIRRRLLSLGAYKLIEAITGQQRQLLAVAVCSHHWLLMLVGCGGHGGRLYGRLLSRNSRRRCVLASVFVRARNIRLARTTNRRWRAPVRRYGLRSSAMLGAAGGE